ncbi:MAG: hypothetical protein A3G95_08895 [Flavobacteria bacterium RIFCSPLOWO2_12_FULL_31_7]|nr:MAG: hypothetical protein A3G95_08895 [Flavobacteria bacterium RIFCSPLOWO2_12_FULL_31_7]
MYNRLLSLKLFLLIVLFFSYDVNGQTLDQNHSPENVSGGGFLITNNGAQNVGQTFIAGQTGEFSEFHFSLGNYMDALVAGDFQLNLYAGDGYGGALLASQTFQINVAPPNNGTYLEHVVNMPAGISMIAGNTYTVDLRGITGTNALVFAPSGNSYTPGGFYFNNGQNVLYDNYDLWFKTYVTPTPSASALNFDGIDDKVLIGNTMNAILDPLNTITVEAWVNPSNTIFNGVIVGNYHNPINTEMQFLLRRDFDTFTFWVNDGTGFKVVDSGLNSVTLNTWQHVAGVWDGSSLYIYIDGILKGITAGVTGSSFATTNNNITIGSNSYPEHFTGSIDEVRIWNRVLNQCEIENNINGELQSGQTGLLAYYKFNQGIPSDNNTSITSLTDSSGNNYNGTLNNFALMGATSNWVSPGGITTNTISPTYQVPNVNAVPSIIICNNSITSPFVFTSSTTGTLCGEANESGNITLTAPVGAVFTSIPFASYGTPNGTCGNYSIGSCHASNSTSIVSAAAIGQNNFSISANNATFGDPCAFTSKRMYIEAIYNNTIFNWTNDTPSIGLPASGTGSIPSFSATNTGSTPIVATITATPMIDGCAGIPIQFTITVNPTAATPTGSSNQVINGGVAADATIEDINVNPTTVVWYGSSSDALAGTNALPAGTQLIDGAEYFAVNEENDCSSALLAVTVNVVLGNDTFDMNHFNLYPNPTSDVVTLQYSKEITEISVLNLLGQTMLNKKLNATVTTIDLSSFPSATYFVKIVSEGKTKTVKVIKN